MSATRVAICTENLTKYYGKKRGIVDVTLNVREGEVFGYLGPNGAGKTTTIRLLLNFIFPTEGRARVFEHDIVRDNLEVRKHVGYLPGELNLYDNITGADFLRYSANLRGKVDWHYVEQLAERLQCELGVRVSSLSHGNRQKIGLVQAFMHRPGVLILDEPTSGLDPLVQQEFYGMVREVKGEERTVFLSSHILPEVERICDTVGIIRDGRLVAVEDIDVLKSHALRRIEIHFGQPVSPDKFAGIEGIRDVSVQDAVLRCTVVGELDALIKTAAAYHVVSVTSNESSLEEVFLAYYSKGETGAP